MAKKKSVSSTSPPKTRTRTSASKPTAQQVVSFDEMGAVAGRVWQQLDQHGELSLAAIKSSVESPADLVMAAVGWLAREDKVLFRKNGRSMMVSLR